MSVCKWFESWREKNICWCRAAAFVSVLVFGYKVVRYTILTVLITFFTEYPNDFKLVKAARYVTLVDAATASFGMVVKYMSDALFSQVKIIGYSISSTITGLLLFSLNLILWGNYDSLYIIGMLLLAAGEAGFSSLLNEFLADQLWGHEQNTNTKGDRAESSSKDQVEDRAESLSEHRVESTVVGQLRGHEQNTHTKGYQTESSTKDRVEDQAESLSEDRVESTVVGQLRGHKQKTHTKRDGAESSSKDRVECPSEDRAESTVEDREEARRVDQEKDRVESPSKDLEEARRVDQERAQEESRKEDRVKARTGAWWNFAWISSVIATFVISNYSWEVIFFTSTLMLVGILVLFLYGISFYHNEDLNVIPEIKTAPSNRHLNYPSAPDQFHGNYGSQLHLSPQVKVPRRLDKAAIIKEDQEGAGRLCTVRQVGVSKHLLKMIPMWSTFIVVGLVSSTGDTFSSEQGKSLDYTDFTFYIVFFLKPISNVAISCFYKKLLNPNRGSKAQQQLGNIVRIWFGMVLSTIFCAVAWRVEVHRLQIVRLKRENPGKIIHNMSIFWLAPQYCLLGLMEGSSKGGLQKFTIGELPDSLNKYASAINGFVINGIGSFLSILFMIANEKLFADTIDDSRLDKYYMRLLFLSFLNMCYYYPISMFYRPIHCT